MLWVAIYYDDGSAWTRGDGPWPDAPVEGVQVVACEGEPHGRYLIHGYDHYWSLDGEELAWADDLGALLRRDLPPLPEGWMKFGRHMPQEEFRALLSDVARDPDLPLPRSPRRRETDWD